MIGGKRNSQEAHLALKRGSKLKIRRKLKTLRKRGTFSRLAIRKALK